MAVSAAWVLVLVHGSSTLYIAIRAPMRSFRSRNAYPVPTVRLIQGDRAGTEPDRGFPLAAGYVVSSNARVSYTVESDGVSYSALAWSKPARSLVRIDDHPGSTSKPPLRRPSRPRLPRQPRPHRPPLLHELCCHALRQVDLSGPVICYYGSSEDNVLKNSTGVAMRRPVRCATAWVKCLVL